MSLTNYSLQTPKKVIGGLNSIEKLAEVVNSFNAERVMIITDNGVWKAGLIEKPKAILESAGIKVEIVNDVPPEPEMQQVKDIYARVKDSDSQVIIGIGGGSSMDVSKLISALEYNKNFEENMLDGSKISKKGLPLIMVPTTAGTGAEVTPNAIVVVPEKEVKIGIVSQFMIPDCVILDPAMTEKLPPAITASTGMDAFAHCIECLTSNKSNPLCDLFALRGIKLISRSIRKAYANGSDMQAREDMLLAAFYGGLSITAAGTTAVHALSYPLGGKYRIAHGVSNAMLLPHVMQFNLDAIEDELVTAASEMGISVENRSKREVAQDVVDSIASMVKDLNIPSDLKKYGITENDLDGIVDAASEQTRLLSNNRKVLSKEDMRAIYMKLM